MALSKPNEYKEVSARQIEETVYAEDINQIISNIEKIKGGQANEAPAATIKDIHERLLALESGSVIKPPTDTEETFEEEVYSFEKTTLEAESGNQILNSDIIDNINNLSLIKSTDGTIYLKGSLTLKSEGTAVIKISKTITGLNKRNFIALSYGIPILLYPYYKDNYIYIILSTTSKEIETEVNIGNIKIYDNNIIAPIDPKYAEYFSVVITEYFGIYLINGKYRLKGSANKVYNSMVMGFVDYDIITQFFNVTNQYLFYEDDNLLISTEGGSLINSVIPILIKFKTNNYIVDIECPIQPSI